MGKVLSFASVSWIVFLAMVVLSSAVGMQAQTKPSDSGATRKPASSKTVLLVDTDDSCKLTVDDQDEGVITPDQSKRISIGLGDHIVKCVVEHIPDLMWRKVIEAKSSEQVVAMVTLKALHIQYDQAVSNLQQQKDKAASAKEQAAAAEQKRQDDEAQLPEKVFALLKGAWRANVHDSDANWRAEGNDAPIPSDEEDILEFQSVNGRTITAQLTWNHGISEGGVKHHTVFSLSFQVPPPNLPSEIRCVESIVTYTFGNRKGPHAMSCGEPYQKDLQIKLLDSNHIQLIPKLVPPSNVGPWIFTR